MAMLRMALRLLRREWRSGELAVLLVSLTVAVAALTGVGFLVDRIGRAVQAQASEVLAADARIETPEPLSPALATEAASLGLKSARLTTLLSVVFRGEVSQLANVRAVSAGYPLRGSLKSAAQAFGTGVVTREIPAAGDCWPDSRLAAALGATPGDTLMVGARALRVDRILIARPDQGSAFVEFAPALLLNDADLAATQLVQPASRMQYCWAPPRARNRYGGGLDARASCRRLRRRQPPDRRRRGAQALLSLASLVAVLRRGGGDERAHCGTPLVWWH
jgi:putative ABC transport system permease protein